MPACDYLENALKNEPMIYPFGLGENLLGPRLRCRSALGFGPREAYCEARNAQFEKESSTKVNPGFRDIFTYDKEIFFPGTQSEAVSAGSPDMIVDIDIADAHMADKPPLLASTQAFQKYSAFQESLGLGRPGLTVTEPQATGRYFIFDAKVLTATLVNRETGDPIKDLELKAARKPDLEALKMPETEAAVPGAAFGPDIVGLQLGMTFDQAEALIRSHMKVGRVLNRERARQPEAATGEFGTYSSSKIYVAEDNSEFIVLYDEPPFAKKIVVGITRQMNFPKGQLTALSARNQLRTKYGQETWSGKDGVGWGDGLSHTTHADTYLHNCLPSIENRLPTDWLQEDGTKADWTPTSSKSGINNGVPNMVLFGDYRGRNCGPVLGMTFSSVNDPKQEDRLIVHLTDPNHYEKLYKESKRLIKAGEATFGEQTAAPDIKL
jgi:hypothetical protein